MIWRDTKCGKIVVIIQIVIAILHGRVVIIIIIDNVIYGIIVIVVGIKSGDKCRTSGPISSKIK